MCTTDVEIIDTEPIDPVDKSEAEAKCQPIRDFLEVDDDAKVSWRVNDVTAYLQYR